jgi:paired amphipathic helix protein Sin3a
MQREWEKVWHTQTQAMYLKSLDHMGIHVKQADKKHFAPKQLVDFIKTKHEEQRRQRSIKGRATGTKFQLSYDFKDLVIVLDILRFMITYAINSPQINNSTSERQRICDFFEKFVMTFFDIPYDAVSDHLRNIDRGTPDEDLEDVVPSELPNGRGKRTTNGKKTDLRRGVLDKGRNGTKGRLPKDGSANGSKESTPDVDSIMDDDAAETAEDQAITEVTNESWAAAPTAGVSEGTQPLGATEVGMKADQPFKREWYSLYSNQNIFVFFSVFQALYRRLKEIKDSEDEARQEGIKARQPKPAKEIGLIEDKSDVDMAVDGESYYSRTLSLVEELIQGEVDQASYEDFLRRNYLKKGWQLYSITDLLKTLCRLGGLCVSTDNKEKTADLIEQFYHDRESKETSYNTEINLRKQADKYIKDGELFLIRWVCDFHPSTLESYTNQLQFPRTHNATVQWLQRDETTFDLDDMERKERWQYYTSSYIRLEPTEGIDRSRLHKTVLTRNLPSGEIDTEEAATLPKPLLFSDLQGSGI